jgi:hypothetical protein
MDEKYIYGGIALVILIILIVVFTMPSTPPYVPGTVPADPKFTPFWSNTTTGAVDLGKAATDEIFAKTLIIERKCNDCAPYSQLVYYKRLTPMPAGWSAYDNMVNVWASASNILNTDFQLFSTIDDLKNNTNSWTFCNYDDVAALIGGFRDCAPTQAANIGVQWNSLKTANDKHVTYSVLTPLCKK